MAFLFLKYLSITNLFLLFNHISSIKTVSQSVFTQKSSNVGLNLLEVYLSLSDDDEMH